MPRGSVGPLGGIHFRFDQVAGGRLGREIATYVYKNNMQAVHP